MVFVQNYIFRSINGRLWRTRRLRRGRQGRMRGAPLGAGRGRQGRMRDRLRGRRLRRTRRIRKAVTLSKKVTLGKRVFAKGIPLLLAALLVAGMGMPAFASSQTMPDGGTHSRSGSLMLAASGASTLPLYSAGDLESDSDPDPDPDPAPNPDPDPDPDPNPDPDPDPNPDPDPPAQSTLVGLYLFHQNYQNYDAPIAFAPNKPAQITEPRGSMELYAQSEFSSGNIDWIAKSGVSVYWSIERTLDESGQPTEKSIAIIDRGSGLVSALGQGNGSIVVRCTASNYDVYGEATINILGNSGVPYVTDMQICDENGMPYADDAEIRVDQDGFGLAKKFYARVTYYDPITGETSIKETFAGDKVENLRWSCSGNSGTASVNEETGVFIAQKTGTVRLNCTIAGGGQLGDAVSDYVIVLCGGDTIQDRDYNPARELKVVVKYATEDKQGIGGESDYEEARTWYYLPADIEELGIVEKSYTLVKSDGNWSTMKARGTYFANLIDDQHLSLDDIKGFYFGATDEYNPGFVGAGWLFGARYYFPNMGIGSGKLGAVQVAPLLALETVQEDLASEPSGDYSSLTRFRLCLGAESTTVNNAQQSIYNVHTITIILEGAPPAQWDKPGYGQGTSHFGSSDEGGGDEGGIGGDDEGEGEGGKEDGEKVSKPSEGNTGVATPVFDSSREPQDAVGGESPEGAQNQAEDEAMGNSLNAPGIENKRFEVYEMIRKDDPEVEALDLDNPLEPLTFPVLLALLIAGGAHTYALYRKELNPLAGSLVKGDAAHAIA